MFLTGSDSIYFGVEKSRAAVALISGFAALPTQQVFCPPFHADQEPWQRASESGTGNWNVHGPRDHVDHTLQFEDLDWQRPSKIIWCVA